MSVYSRIHEYIFKDTSAENESRDRLVLVRIFSLLDAFVALFYAFALYGCAGSSAVVISMIFTVANLIIFGCTYRTKSLYCSLMHCLLVAVFSVVYCLLYGNKLGLRFLLFTLIPLIYYRADLKLWLKLVASSLCGIVSITLGVIAIWDSTPVMIPDNIMILAVIVNTLEISIKFIVAALFYYRKYAEGESKILLYSKKLEQLANVDALTQLSNRRSMKQHLDRLAGHYQSMNQHFCISICDIDFFKIINDTYGHDAGDYVLVQLSAIFKEFMSGKGRVARWGGEEFLLVFEGINGDYAFEELGGLRHLIETAEFHYKENTIRVTLTFGLEEYDMHAGIQEIIAKADEKLYQGKKRGRNCVIY